MHTNEEQRHVGKPHPHDHHSENVGRVITRRQALQLFTAPLILALAGCTRDSAGGESYDAPLTGSCVVRPEMTAGPFYIDDDLVRADIREGKAGVPLALAFTVSTIVGEACAPLEGAAVDVWHADASGDYSGTGGLRDERFLRGTQVTDADGRASFATIYPGWYPGRTPHIHFKVRSAASASATYDFTSQLFFDDALSRQVYQQQVPYRARGAQDRTNARDGIYRRGGDQMLLALSEADGGYTATFDLALHID